MFLAMNYSAVIQISAVRNIWNFEWNSYISIRFDSKRAQLFKIFESYHHRFLTYLTE